MRRSLLAFACLTLSACSGQNANSGTNEVNLRVLTSGLQCAKTQSASIAEISSSEELNARLPDSTPADISTALKHERVLMISMGVRPTAGYHLSLAQPRARLDGKVLTLSILWREPAPGSIAAQVITQPCLIVAVEKREYSEVRALDQNGVERARLAVR